MIKALFSNFSTISIHSIAIECFVWLALFLAPIKISMWIILFLIFSDVFFGTWASLKEGDNFSSRALRRTLGKVFIYEFLLVFSLILETFVFKDTPIIKGAISFVSIVEGISILENIKRISGIDALDFIFNRINKNADSGKFLNKLKQNNRKRKSK